MTEVVTEWLIFSLKEQKARTQVWDVLSKQGRSKLGVIKWYNAWRHYCFIIDAALIEELFKTKHELVYSDRCSQSITDFVSKLNREHQEALS